MQYRSAQLNMGMMLLSVVVWQERGLYCHTQKSAESGA